MVSLIICKALLLIIVLQVGALDAAVVDDGFPYCRGIDSVCRGKAAPIDGSSVLPDQDLYIGTVSVPQIGYQGVRPDTSDYATPVASFHNGQLVKKLTMGFNAAANREFLGYVELLYTDGYVERIGSDQYTNTGDLSGDKTVEYLFQTNEIITAIRIWSKVGEKESDSKYNYYAGGSGNPFPYVSKIQFDTNVHRDTAFEWCVLEGSDCGDIGTEPLQTLTDLGSGLLAGVHGKFRYNYVNYVPTAFTAIGFYFAGPVVKSNLGDILMPYLEKAIPPQAKQITQVIRKNEEGLDNATFETTETVSESSSHTYSLADTSSEEKGWSTSLRFSIVGQMQAAKTNSETTVKYEGKWTTSDTTTTSDTQSSSSTSSVRFTFPPAPAGQCVMYLAYQGSGKLTTSYSGTLRYTIQNPGGPAKNMSIDTTGQFSNDLTTALWTQAYIVNCTSNAASGPVLLAEAPGLHVKTQVLEVNSTTSFVNSSHTIQPLVELPKAATEAANNSTSNNVTATVVALQQQGSSSAAQSDDYPFCNSLKNVCRGKAINKDGNTDSLLALDPDLYIDGGRWPTSGYQTDAPNQGDYAMLMASFRNGQLVRKLSLGYNSAGESDFLGYIVITFTDMSTERIGQGNGDSNRLKEYTFRPDERITEYRLWRKAGLKENDGQEPYQYISKIQFDTTLTSIAFEWCVIKDDKCDNDNNSPHVFTELGSGLLAGVRGGFRYNYNKDVPTAFTSIGFYFAGPVEHSNLGNIEFPYLDDAVPPQPNTVVQVNRNNTLGHDIGIVETTATVTETNSHTYTRAHTTGSERSTSVEEVMSAKGLIYFISIKGTLNIGYSGKWTASTSTSSSSTQTSTRTTSLKLTFPPAPVGQCVTHMVYQGAGQLTTFYRGLLNYTILNPTPAGLASRTTKVLSIDTTGQYVGDITSGIQSQSFNCTDGAAGDGNIAPVVTDPALQIGTQDLGVINQTCVGCTQQLGTSSGPFRLTIPQVADTPAINNEAATLNTNLGGGALGQNSFAGLG